MFAICLQQHLVSESKRLEKTFNQQHTQLLHAHGVLSLQRRSSSCYQFRYERCNAGVIDVIVAFVTKPRAETSITFRPPTFRHPKSPVLHITLVFSHLSLPS